MITRRLTARIYAGPTLHAPVVIIGDPAANTVEVETLAGGVGGWAEPGKKLRVARSILHDIQPEQTAIVEPTDSLERRSNPLVVGARVFTLHHAGQESEEVTSGHVAVLDSVSDGVAMLVWWDEHHWAGPSVRAQAFRADRVTHNAQVACTWPLILRQHGWNI